MPDCADVPDSVKELMRNVPVLIIDGLRDKPHPTHLTVKKACQISREVNAGKTWLTHMAHFFLHKEKEKKLPKGVKLAYDELELKI